MIDKDSLITNLQNRIIVLEKLRQSDSLSLNLMTHTTIDNQNRITTIENNYDSFSKSDYISVFSVLISLISALCLASYFSFKIFKKKQFLKRKFLTGSWTSEGDVTNPQPLPYLSFVLDVDLENGEITGTFHPNNDSYPVVFSINGKLKFRKAIVEITHFSQQRQLVYGVAELKLRGKLLYWKTISGEEELFPKLSYTWKTDYNPNLF